MSSHLIVVLSDRGYDDYPGPTIAELSKIAYEYYSAASAGQGQPSATPGREAGSR